MIIVENSDEINANTRLKFKDKKEEDFKTVHAIVIGGDVLSRGLTIEGLVSSYFLRDRNKMILLCKWEDGLDIEMDMRIYQEYG